MRFRSGQKNKRRGIVLVFTLARQVILIILSSMPTVHIQCPRFQPRETVVDTRHGSSSGFFLPRSTRRLLYSL